MNRSTIGKNYYEIYLKASLDTVIKRDRKGLYQKALNGEIDNFIGVSSEVPYEVPENPDLILDTENLDIKACVNLLVDFAESRS